MLFERILACFRAYATKEALNFLIGLRRENQNTSDAS
jgi:hypothetical protein